MYKTNFTIAHASLCLRTLGQASTLGVICFTEIDTVTINSHSADLISTNQYGTPNKVETRHCKAQLVEK